MIAKHFFILILILVIVGVFVYLFLQGDFFTVLLEDMVPLTESETDDAPPRSHPFISQEKRAAAEKVPVKTWDEWVEAIVEIWLGSLIEQDPNLLNNPEAIAKERTFFFNKASWLRRQFEELNIPHPAYPIWPSGSQLEKLNRTKFPPPYTGPQTPKALITEFNEKFLKRYPESSDWNEHYPIEEWLQRLLNKGAHFQDFSDYSYYLKLRRDLLVKKNQPDEWKSGEFGIPISTNFENYENGFIDRRIWENVIHQKIEEEYPNEPETTIYFSAKHPEKYLPVIGRMTYVHRGKDATIRTWGTTLTDEQRNNLLYKGIEPEDIEIVYIDDEYNILSEKPKPYNREEWLKENSFITEFDGIPITPENYEKVLGEPMSDQWENWYDKKHAEETQLPVEPSPADVEAAREAARETAAAAQEAAKAEFEKFQNNMRNLAKFATMSDAEIEKALERQFRRQFLPEHPVEQFTPERLEEALGTLFQHGFEEGFRRVRRDSPALAEQLEQYFGQGQKPPPKTQKKSQRPAPPKPPEAAPPETEAP